MMVNPTHRLRFIEDVAGIHVDVELAQHVVLNLAGHRFFVRLRGVGANEEQEGSQDGYFRHLEASNLGSD